MSDGEVDSILPEAVPKLVLPEQNGNISDDNSNQSEEADQPSHPIQSDTTLTSSSARFNLSRIFARI